MILERGPAGRRARLFSGSVHTFELPALAEALRAEEYYHWHGCDGVSLLETPELHLYLEVLRTGVAAAPPAGAGPLTIQVLGGEVRFEAEGEVLYLREGEILVLHELRPHTLEAVRDAVLLATISRSPLDAATGSPGPVSGNAGESVPAAPRRWAAVQDRYPADWPAEAGDEQC